MPFALPMSWREPKNHVDDCCFCLTKVKGFSATNRMHIAYPNLDSAIWPVLHSSALSMEKLKAGIFDGLQICQLIKDKHLDNSMEANEHIAWKCYVLVVKNFLGSTTAENYKELVSNMIDAFKDLECNMSIKLHYLYSHIDTFPENLGSMSNEQGEQFHQDSKEMEIRYQGRWDAAMMADYCWSLKRDIVHVAHSRMPKNENVALKSVCGYHFSCVKLCT